MAQHQRLRQLFPSGDKMLLSLLETYCSGTMSPRCRAACVLFGFSFVSAVWLPQLSAQTSSMGIVGPATAIPSQPLTFRLTNGNQQLVPDTWRQLYNPDRYIGTEYVSSFDLQLQPNSDGSLTVTARYPGQYKIAATAGANQYTAAVVVKPAQPPARMKGLDFTLPRALDKTAVAEAIAIARHTGADWAHIVETVCFDLNTPGAYQYTDQPSSWCDATPFSDLFWVIDELHNQGFKVALEPSSHGFYQGHLDELEDFLPGNDAPYPKIPSSQVAALFQAWARMALDEARLAEAHKVEIYIPGSHDTATYEGAVVGAMNADWKSLIQSIRGSYNGQIWWGPVGPCGLGESFPFTNYSLVDGIWFSGLVLSASTPECSLGYLAPGISEGINNIHAEQMLDYVRAWRVAGPGFQFGKKYGLPMLWTDFNPDPIDGMNYHGGHYGGNGGGVQSGANPGLTRDNQEGADFLDSVMQAGVMEGGFQGVFPGPVHLSAVPYFTDLLARPAALASLTNWYGGDMSYFSPCMTSPPQDVLFQLLPSSCPAFLKIAQVSLFKVGVMEDSTSSVRTYFQGSGTDSSKAEFGDPSWSDYEVSMAVRLHTNLSLLDACFRYSGGQPFGAYCATFGQGFVKLTKITSDGAANQTQTVFAEQALPGAFDPAHWYQVGITAIGSAISVKIDGKQLIQYSDGSVPLLRGSFSFHTGVGTTDFGNVLVQRALAPQLTVVNAASFAPGVIAPGEIVTLFGTQLGPQALVVAAGDKSFPTSLAGTQVMFNGIPAPLIYTQAGQVSAVVPWELSGSATATVTVQYQGVSSTPIMAVVAGSSAALFTASGGGFGQGAILNQDYSVNSPLNPAKGGSVILLYGTGGGALQGPADNGVLASGAAQLNSRVLVVVGGQPAQVLYAGTAPGLVNGVVQINVQLPAGITGNAVPVLATVGQYISQSGVTIAIQ